MNNCFYSKRNSYLSVYFRQRMALLALVTIPVGMVFMMSVTGNYSKDYEGTVKVTKEITVGR